MTTLPPHLYHLAESSNLASILRDGLLPASTLLHRAGLPALIDALRPHHTVLPTGVSVRDQKPMPPDALARCLVGMSPAEWYATINARVFFWLDPDRLARQRAACGDRPQVTLTFDAARLVGAYRDRVFVTPINTGNARRRPARRGVATFVPYEAWLADGWASEAQALGTKVRARSHEVVEVTVLGEISDARDFIFETGDPSSSPLPRNGGEGRKTKNRGAGGYPYHPNKYNNTLSNRAAHARSLCSPPATSWYT